MSVYIIHSSLRVGSPRHSANHYIGFTDRKVTVRHREHLVSQDVPLINAFKRAGAKLFIGKVFEGADRDFEKALKRNGHKNNYCVVCREEKIIRKQIGLTEVQRSVNQVYYVIGYTDDGKHFDGKPKVVDTNELHEERQKCEEATDGNWTVAVLHEFTVTHYEESKKPMDELRTYFEDNGMPVDEDAFAKMKKHLEEKVIEIPF